MISRLWRGGAIFPAIAFFVCALSCASSSEATIRYEVSLNHPEQHLFHVTMTIPNVNGEVEVEIPAWNALYQIRDFAADVGNCHRYVEEVLLRMTDRHFIMNRRPALARPAKRAH